MSFAQTLKMARKKAGFSQIDFALAAGVSQATVHHWEKGNRIPKSDKRAELEKILSLEEKALSVALPAAFPTAVSAQKAQISKKDTDIKSNRRETAQDKPQDKVVSDQPFSKNNGYITQGISQQSSCQICSEPIKQGNQDSGKNLKPSILIPELGYISKISFQGELGAYSHQAAMNCFPQADVIACDSFESALSAVSDSNLGAELAMIPIENSQYGRVSDIHQLLPNSPLYIVGEYFLPVQHMLLGTQDAELDDIKVAISHPQALGQTRSTLNALNISRKNWSDTAGAALEVSRRQDKTWAAVASQVAAQHYGLKILRKRIEDRLDNVTRFIIMSPRRIDPPINIAVTITSVFFTLRSIPSALYKCLGGFATQGVNIRKLESYVGFDEHNKASFYCEFEGNPNDSNVFQAMNELEFFTSRARILGVYAAANKIL